jgi:RNA polymerase sigma-70 factor (ECF subfamily)
MDEDAFRLLYEQTARAIWVYLARTSGDDRLADDLLQETYVRFLRSRASFASDDHRRNYLFRIATNLVRDHRRRTRVLLPALGTNAAPGAGALDSTAAERMTNQIDVSRALARLKPRERSLLWLAYAQGLTHAEIAAVLGLRTGSLKALLHRARRRLHRLLGSEATS